MPERNSHWKRLVRERLPSIGLSGEREMEIVEELATHLEATYEEELAGGASEEEATAQALLQIDDWRLLECELSRAERSRIGQWMSPRSQPGESVMSYSQRSRVAAAVESFLLDLRYGLRMLVKRPGFTAMAVLTLALGIGANTAVFSVVYSVLLGPLPYERPDELAIIWCKFQKMGASRAPASGVQLREIRDRSQRLQDLAGIWVGTGTLTGGQEPEQIKLASVTPNFFDVLGAKPLLGRSFAQEDQAAQGEVAIILSYGLWQRRFGADPNIVGSRIQLQNRGVTVVGVMAQDFQLLFPPDANVPLDTQAWIPFASDIYALPRDLYYIRLLGRLKPGVTLKQAQEEADSISQQLRSQFTEFASENLELEVVPLRGDAVRDIRPALLALLAGAIFVLLIACVNVANLLLSHANIRRREIAVRAALGASQGRIIRQLLSESLLLCCLGGVAGLGIGWWGVRMLLSLRPDILARVGAVELNWPVLGFVTALSLFSGLLFGLAPALEARRVSLTESLKEAGRSAAASGRQRTRTVLVISEVAIGFILLVGAGLMMRTLAQIHQVDPGFKTDGVLTFELNLSGGNYATGTQRTGFVARWEEKLRSLPQVATVGAVSHLPLDDYPNWYSPYAPEGLTEDEKNNLLADHRCITPGYFQALGTKLLGGRYFDDQDGASGRRVVIVDEMLARQTWPNENAVGKKIQVEHFVEGNFEPAWAEVVGLVEHIRHHSLTRQIRGQIYIPYTQSPRPHLSYVVKTTGDPLALATTVRQELRMLDQDMALSKVRPLQGYVEKDMASAHFITVLATIFGGLALLLAAIGVYGVLSYSVNQRAHEIGVRLALGAQPRDVLMMMIRQGLMTTLIGVGIGLISSIWLTKLLSSLLFGVSATDPTTFIAVPVVLTLVALLACYIPARRATKVDPLIVLRYE